MLGIHIIMTPVDVVRGEDQQRNVTKNDGSDTYFIPRYSGRFLLWYWAVKVLVCIDADTKHYTMSCDRVKQGLAPPCVHHVVFLNLVLGFGGLGKPALDHYDTVANRIFVAGTRARRDRRND